LPTAEGDMCGFACVDLGACTTDSDCCNGLLCAPDGMGGLVCYPTPG